MSETATTTPVLPIEGGLTVYEALPLKDQLLAVLEQGQGLRLDLSGVSEIDGAGVQLLLAARREAQVRGQAFALLQPSPVVREALALVRIQTGNAA